MSIREKQREQYVLWLETATQVEQEKLNEGRWYIHHNFQRYTDANVCVDFICGLSAEQSCVFLILAAIEYTYLPEMLFDLPQIAYIYLYVQNDEELRLSNKEHIRFSTNNLKNILYAVTRDIELKEGIPPVTSVFNFNTTVSERSVHDLCSDQQSATFVWFQLLVDVIRQLPHTDNDKGEMVAFLRDYFQACPKEQEQLDAFVRDYNSKEAIQSYTRTGFLFRVLNRALRTQNIDNIFKLRYYLQDLYNQIEAIFAKQREQLEMMVVYRGQLMHREDFDTLRKNITSDSLVAFNSFLSTTFEQDAALVFAGSDSNIDADEVSVCFEMLLSLEQSKFPLAHIADLSAIRTEEETLVALGSVFKIDQIVENQEKKYWHVKLTLNEEVSTRLSALTHYLREETGNQSSLMILGRLLGDMGDHYRAERYFRLLLNDLPEDHPDLGTVLNNLGILAHKQDQHEKAIDFFQRALLVLPDGHGDQTCAHVNMGASYQALGKENEAMNAYQRAIKLGLLPADQAKVYNNMGAIYRHQGHLGISVHYHQLSLQLRSPHDPELVGTHVNLALAYADMRDDANSSAHRQSALDAIKTLPGDSLRIGMAHFAFGLSAAKMKRHLAAVAHFSDALSAYRQMTTSFIVTQSIVKTLFEQGRSYMELDEDALALAAFHEALPLASSDERLADQVAFVQHSIGHVYDQRGALRRALHAYMTALNVWEDLLKKGFQVDRHVLAQFHNDIGEIHDKKKQYAFALWHYTRAIQFAEGDRVLVQEYQQNLKFAAEGALHVLRKNLNVHIIEYDPDAVEDPNADPYTA